MISLNALGLILLTEFSLLRLIKLLLLNLLYTYLVDFIIFHGFVQWIALQSFMRLWVVLLPVLHINDSPLDHDLLGLVLDYPATTLLDIGGLVFENRFRFGGRVLRFGEHPLYFVFRWVARLVVLLSVLIHLI